MQLEDPESDTFQDKSRERSKDRTVDKRVETYPVPASGKIMAIGAIVPIALAAAATLTTYLTNNEQIAMTSWISVAVVGTASVISTSIAAMHRTKSVDRDVHADRSKNL